jgi:hypothetical protein
MNFKKERKKKKTKNEKRKGKTNVQVVSFASVNLVASFQENT